MKKYLVTSGCSFTDNYGQRWPHYLAQRLELDLYNRGQGSCGNDWIARTAIYQTNLLLKSGIKPEEILVAVMWSGIDRKSLFVCEDTPGYNGLKNGEYGNTNPVHFLDGAPNHPCSLAADDGYLVGSMTCNFQNQAIKKLKRDLIMNYYPDESLAVESYDNFLKLQWYCDSLGITLVNTTYMDIMHYPHRRGKKTWEIYRNVGPLSDMIDWGRWLFYGESAGLYEWTVDGGLPTYSDGVHPLPESHDHWVKNFLMPNLERMEII